MAPTATTAAYPPIKAKDEPRKAGTFILVRRWKRRVPIPAKRRVALTDRPVRAGTRTVAPNMDPETLARLVFCFENSPERDDGIVSGAQDAIGICVPGLARHYYDNHFWPERIETCEDERILSWLESHLCMLPMEPRPQGCSVVEGKDITGPKVKALADAADRCWAAITALDLEGFAAAYQASFEAQVAMFPAMVQGSVQEYIDRYSSLPGVRAWKMPGAGGGGYFACVVDDAPAFAAKNPGTILLKIRRPGM